jgi:hypothetical protein
MIRKDILRLVDYNSMSKVRENVRTSLK